MPQSGYSQLHVPASQCDHIKPNGERCGAWSVAGSPKCWHHGGAGAGNAAFTNVVKQATTAASMLYGAPIEIDAVSALEQEIYRTAGHVSWLQEQIATSQPDMFAKSMWLYARQSGHVREDEIDNWSWKAAQAVWLDLYLKERQHLVRTCTAAIAAGLEERKVKLAETMVEQVGLAITQMLTDLGLDATDPSVRTIAHRALSQAAGLAA